MDLQILHDEIETDPQSLGYKNGEDWKGDAEIVELINDPNNGAIITRKLIQPDEIIESIDVTEWENISEARRQYIELVTKSSLIDANQSPIFDGISETFSVIVAPNTRTAILSKIQRQGSRAEVLWGENKTVTIPEVAHAANL